MSKLTCWAPIPPVPSDCSCIMMIQLIRYPRVRIISTHRIISTLVLMGRGTQMRKLYLRRALLAGRTSRKNPVKSGKSGISKSRNPQTQDQRTGSANGISARLGRMRINTSKLYNHKRVVMRAGLAPMPNRFNCEWISSMVFSAQIVLQRRLCRRDY